MERTDIYMGAQNKGDSINEPLDPSEEITQEKAAEINAQLKKIGKIVEEVSRVAY
jgi:hypothetical protein